MTRQGQVDARYHRAKREGFAARSVYKLEEMDRRYQLLRPNQRVLDLGAHPGSWLQYACQRVGRGGLVVGVDIQEAGVDLPAQARYLQADLLALEPQDLRAFAPAYDVVLSDVAPRTTGVMHADMAASYELTAKALDLALELLKPGGSLVAKVYFGPQVEELIKRVKAAFTLGKAHKPEASRSASKEIYLLGRGLKKAAQAPGE
ncbi:MAG: RlmE family RNA methyltransferase [Desulfarculus sp.]|nr:RlmE family RNA methyltransferase [Desulfarculus sp.]